MGTETPTVTAPASDRAVEEKINQLRELFADAPEVGKAALENALHELTSQAATTPPPPIESAGRVGSRLGNVSELTIRTLLVNHHRLEREDLDGELEPAST